ncbi:hypothetical protein CFP56_002213 [Quercus suber]|uniref:Uncharacterized protein n=1 Tax=Quercus suber TaxID=58331 RepID=A0AAW0MAT3_QUESU
MAIVEIIVSAALICKISRGSNTKSAIAFKQGQTGCGEFERDKWRVGNVMFFGALDTSRRQRLKAMVIVTIALSTGIGALMLVNEHLFIIAQNI